MKLPLFTLLICGAFSLSACAVQQNGATAPAAPTAMSTVAMMGNGGLQTGSRIPARNGQPVRSTGGEEYRNSVNVNMPLVDSR